MSLYVCTRFLFAAKKLAITGDYITTRSPSEMAMLRLYEGETALVTNDVLEVTGRDPVHSRSMPMTKLRIW